MKYLWVVEERLSKRGAWNHCDVLCDGKKDAEAVAANYRERAAPWGEWEYRVVKYVREEAK